MCDYVDVKFIQVSSGNYYFVDVVYIDSENNLYCNHIVPCKFCKNAIVLGNGKSLVFPVDKNVDREFASIDLAKICSKPVKFERRNIVFEASVKKEIVEQLKRLMEGR